MRAMPRAAARRRLAWLPALRFAGFPTTRPEPSKMPQARDTAEVTGRDRLLVLLLAFAWGGNWIAGAIALHGTSPWTLRFFGSSLAVLTLIAAALITGRTLKVPRGQRIHIMVAGFLNVALFQVLSGLRASQRRDLARRHPQLFDADLDHDHELRCARRAARPHAAVASGSAPSAWRAGVAADREGRSGRRVLLARLRLGLGGATVYSNGSNRPCVPRNAAWQLVSASSSSPPAPSCSRACRAVACVRDWCRDPVRRHVGTGFAHFLWWSIVGRLPPVTASIGSLLVPVIGVGRVRRYCLASGRPCTTWSASP